MPGLSRKLRLAVDWTLDLLFSREYVQLNVHRRTTNTTIGHDSGLPGHFVPNNPDPDAQIIPVRDRFR
jgi:hypothetical protein